MPAKKQIKEVSSTGCSFCIIKDNEINKLNKKIVDLKTEIDQIKVKKEKKELTQEQLDALKAKQDEKKKKDRSRRGSKESDGGEPKIEKRVVDQIWCKI